MQQLLNLLSFQPLIIEHKGESMKFTQKLKTTFLVTMMALICSVSTAYAKTVTRTTFDFATAKGVKHRVEFYRDDVFRILAANDVKDYKDPKNDPKKAQILVGQTPKVNNLTMTDKDGVLTFKTSKMTLTFTKATDLYTLTDESGKVIWKEIKPITLTKKATTQTLSSGTDEFYYGGGQQNGYFSHKGTKIDIRTDGNWNEGGHPNPAPFYMSNKGYGVLRHTFSQGVYDFTKNQEVILLHKENRFDAFFFVGASFNRLVDLYTQFTGRPNFMPIWALELGEADAYMTRDKKKEGKPLVLNEKGEPVEHTPHVIERLAEKYRAHDMPCGWILPNDGYGCGYTELPRVVKELKQLGFYTGLWTEGELTKTNWEVGTAGTRLQKLDVAWTGPAYQHGLTCNKQAWTSLVTNSDSRGFVWTVQGWAGTQRYGICWTGDQYGSWDLIRYHIPTLIGSGMSGQAYATTDVDGIFGGSPETYTRDLQWKCFTPVLYAMNGWAGKISKSPWAYDEPYRSINRDYLKLKMRMTPYMYKYCKEAYDTGAPITRGMIWDNPNDKKTWDKSTQYQYMLGEWLLIAPVYTSMKSSKGWRKEDIYLTEGQWIDYWDGRRIEGNSVIDAYPVTLEKLPILVKAGAIIPMYPEMLYNNQKPKDPLTFDIYPYGDSEFQMYEDDGLTRKYQKGQFATQRIKSSAPKGTAGDITITVGKSIGEFDGKLESRVYQFMIHTELKPKSIVINGNETVLELHDKAAHNGSEQSWYYDKDDKRGVVYVRLFRRSTSEDIKMVLDIDENGVIEPSPAYPVPVITPELDPTEFTVTTNSQQGTTLNNAFDGTPETFWHSNYNKKDKKSAKIHPYIVDIKLNGLYAVNGFDYLARQGGGNGLIKDYEIYVSRNPDDMGKPVAKGSYVKGDQLQSVNFPVVWGEYVRFVALSGINGNKFAAAAEFSVRRSLTEPKLADKVQYLSDMKPVSAKGEYKNDKSVSGKTISVNEQTYKKGIGVKANSELVYKIDGTWDTLYGHVGLDDEIGDGGSAMFRVYVDGNLLFESPKQNGQSIKQLMNINIKGAKELKLVLVDCGDGNTNDHGDWVDAKLILKGSE